MTQRPETPDNQNTAEIRTPAKFYVPVDKLPPMAGAEVPPPQQNDTCDLTFNQRVCVTGEVTTTVTTACEARVRCVDSGIITDTTPVCVGTPAPCKFKFFAELCVEVDVMFSGSAVCVTNPPLCEPAMEGPCPPENGA